MSGLVAPILLSLAGWSIRWGVLIALLGGWLCACPPRRAATRSMLCLAVLVLGLLLPLAPGWAIPWPDWTRSNPPTGTASLLQPAPRLPPEVKSELMSDDVTSPTLPPPRAEPRPIPVVNLARTTGETGSVLWAFVLILSSIWLLGVVGMLARLAAGGWVLRRLRREASPLVGPAAVFFQQAQQAASPGRRGVLGASHPALASPIVVGGWSPLILVPAAWDTWTEADQRACLLHELAHLARGDDAWKWLAELARVPFWFHPGVAWLAARLDREAELAADEAAVAHGIAPRELAQLLLTQAQNSYRIDPRPHALAFFTPTTVSTRIHRLLEADMTRAAVRPSRIQQGVLIAPLLAFALAVGGARGGVVGPVPPAPQAPPAAPVPAPSFTVTVQDDAGTPVAGATVVAGKFDTAVGRQVVVTGLDGRARLARALASREFVVGIAPGRSFATQWSPNQMAPEPTLTLVLPQARTVTGSVVDPAGQPIEGAEVRVRRVTQARDRLQYADSWADLIAGTPLVAAVSARTDRAGRFQFEALPAGATITLIASSSGRATTPTPPFRLDEAAAGQPESSPRIVLGREARVQGQVVADVPGAIVAGLAVLLRGRVADSNDEFTGRATTDAAGRFEIGGLSAGQANLFLDKLPADGAWTYQPALNVPVGPGKPAPVAIKLVAGVEVTGIVTNGPGQPLAGLQVSASQSVSLQMATPPLRTVTDSAGRYRFRLIPGGVTFFVNPEPTKPTDLRHAVTIPAGPTSFAVEPIAVDTGPILTGKLVDAAGVPVPGAKLAAASPIPLQVPPLETASTVTDAEGRFELRNKAAAGQQVPLDQSVLFHVSLTDGREFAVVAVPTRNPAATTIKLRTFAAGGPAGPDQVAADEVAGLVVDPQGRPIAGAVADAQGRVPGGEVQTDAAGVFRIKGLSQSPGREFEIRKEGYAPLQFFDVPLGRKGWVVVLDNQTAFEGRILTPDGKPVADAPILADGGERRAGIYVHLSRFRGRSGADGRYRLPLPTGIWDLSVRVPGVGVLNLPKQVLATDEVHALDLQLIPPVTFLARVVDAGDGSPVAGFFLRDFAWPEEQGTSDAAGMIRIPDAVPGRFDYRSLPAVEVGRYWSADAVTNSKGPTLPGFMTATGLMDFHVTPRMEPVVIQTERVATIRGRVVDPDGQPRAGASIAIGKIRSEARFLGGGRFRATTDATGAFTIKLPASLTDAYMLVAHDGPPRELGTWADGVSPFLETQPGQVLNDVTIHLNRPVTIEGRVVDFEGKPVANQEVQAAVLERNSRRTAATVRTDRAGTFRFDHLNPGRLAVQIEPFTLSPTAAAPDTAQVMTLTAGETRSGVVLKQRLEILAPPERSVKRMQ